MIMKPAYYACIFLETTGVTHICWVLSHLMRLAFGMKEEEVAPTEDLEPAADVLEKVEAALNVPDDSSSSASGSRNSTENNLQNLIKETKQVKSSGKPETKFTGLVKKLGEQVDDDTLRVLRHYLDTHPEKFHQFPSVVGNKMYPSPYQIGEKMMLDGHEVPLFLTDISHPHHIPPHIVACELLSQNKQLQEEIDFLKIKLDSV